jgi:hypothetical protein
MSEFECAAVERPPRERRLRSAAILVTITGLYVLGVGAASAHNTASRHHTNGWGSNAPMGVLSEHGQRSTSGSVMNVDLDSSQASGALPDR